MGKIEKLKYSVKIALGSVLVLFVWWVTITGYSLGDPINPAMLLWGVVFVFTAIFGPVVGLLIWPLLIARLLSRIKNRARAQAKR